LTTPSSPGAQLLAQIAAGGSPDLMMLVARGLLPVASEDLIPLQVDLARGDQPALAREAAAALKALDARVVAHYIERDGGPVEMTYFALEVATPSAVAAVIRRRDVPRKLLVELARRLPPDLQEALLLRQDAIVELPEILDALADNPDLSNYARRRIGEYREHLIPREPAAEPPPPRRGEEVEEADEATAQAAIAMVRGKSPPPGETDDVTGLTEGQIHLLPVPVRLHLTKGAKRLLRSILVRDPHPQVAVAVLKVNPLSDQEIEQIAASRLVVAEVFEEIFHRRQWISKYNISRTLVFNSRVPVPIALRLVPRLGVRDLRLLSRDRNVADPVRALGQRLYRIKRL
jgi:hypothetical protein